MIFQKIVQHTIKLILIVIFISACSSKKKVDFIYYNANIFAVDSSFSKHQAMAIHKGKIVFIGTTNDAVKYFESEHKIDVKQQFIYPGLHDAHCHFVGYAGDMYKCQLYGSKSFDEVLKKVREYDATNELTFIYGRGWDQNDWPIKQFPNNIKINKLFKNKAVILKRIDGHAILINEFLFKKASRVLEKYMNTSFIQKVNGKPTGILFDTAMDEVEKLLPKISRKTLIKNIIKAQKECFELGLTTVTDAGLNYDDILLIDSLQKANVLKLRMNIMVMATTENLSYFATHTFTNTNLLRVASLKVYADGALGSRGACLKQPYTDDSGNFGKLNIPISTLDSIADWAIKHKFQMNTHAIGDSTNSVILKLYASKLKAKNNLRWRVEHAQVVDKKDVHYFYDYNIIASVQPTHATSDMYWAKERLGSQRINNAYSYGNFIKQGVSIALGTDFPVEYLNPLYTFYAATSRQNAKGFPTEGFNIEDALTREQTLRGMTIDAAYAAFWEQNIGSLEVGKQADFIITNFNFMKDNLLKIRNSKIIETHVAGKIIK